MSQNWRQNPNLAECFESCVAMFRRMPVARVTERDEWIAEIRNRRSALDLSQERLSLAMGMSRRYIAGFECGSYGGKGRYERITSVLSRIEAERAQAAE